MKPGKSAWTVVEGHAAQVKIVEFGKGLYATVEFTNGKKREVLKELLSPKKPFTVHTTERETK